jgi:hypothetical protein
MYRQRECQVKKGMAWKKYLNYYPYLLAYDLNESYPYKELADVFRLDVVVIRHMVDWLQRKPEVIAWIRALFDAESIPNWVGELEGDVDYVAYLRTKGVDVQSGWHDTLHPK